MTNTRRIRSYTTLRGLTNRIKDDLNNKDFVLLYAYNGIGKTRLSVNFRKQVKEKNTQQKLTLYYNAFTEDLFTWNNDLAGDTEQYLYINEKSALISGLWGDKQQRVISSDINVRIYYYLQRYGEFNFRIDTENDWKVRFYKEIDGQRIENIKISRGEESIFIWCVFLAVCELALTKDNGEYEWVKYIYIDDPVSSLDDNNIIAIACDLCLLLTNEDNEENIKFVISSHHSLFFNVVYNELRTQKKKVYYLNSEKGKTCTIYKLQSTDDTPFFYHVAMLAKIKQAIKNNKLYTYHFNIMRSIMEKQANFWGHDNIRYCLHGIEEEVLQHRALQLLSHGSYSLYERQEMGEDTKKLFIAIVNGFTKKYDFNINI